VQEAQTKIVSLENDTASLQKELDRVADSVGKADSMMAEHASRHINGQRVDDGVPEQQSGPGLVEHPSRPAVFTEWEQSDSHREGAHSAGPALATERIQVAAQQSSAAAADIKHARAWHDSALRDLLAARKQVMASSKELQKHRAGGPPDAGAADRAAAARRRETLTRMKDRLQLLEEASQVRPFRPACGLAREAAPCLCPGCRRG
jgi:hypothetical protein